jgi:hypothetical protein
MRLSPAWPVIEQQNVACRIDLSQLKALIAMQQGAYGRSTRFQGTLLPQALLSDAHAKICSAQQPLAFGEFRPLSAKGSHSWA